MDPNQTYREMKDALREGNLATACELALALKKWPATGGFHPIGHTIKEVESCIMIVLRRTNNSKP